MVTLLRSSCVPAPGWDNCILLPGNVVLDQPRAANGLASVFRRGDANVVTVAGSPTEKKGKAIAGRERGRGRGGGESERARERKQRQSWRKGPAWVSGSHLSLDLMRHCLMLKPAQVDSLQPKRLFFFFFFGSI